MALAATEALESSEWLTLSVRTVTDSPPLKNGARLRAILGTHATDARLRLLDADLLEGGAAGFAQIRCIEPVAVPAGEHVILRLPSPPRTIAGVKCSDARRAARAAQLPTSLATGSGIGHLPAAEMIAAEVARQAPGGRRCGAYRGSPRRARAAPEELIQTLPFVVTRSGLVVRKADVDDLLSCIPALLARYSTGLAHEQLLRAFSRAAPRCWMRRWDAAGSGTVRSSAAASSGSGSRAGRAASATRPSRLAHRGGSAAGRAYTASPAASSGLQSSRAGGKLVGEGVIVRALDRAKGKEILFHRDAIEEARRRLAPLLEREPGLLVSEVGGGTRISRKYSMPLLGHLDTIRFTRRVKDHRMPA